MEALDTLKMIIKLFIPPIILKLVSTKNKKDVILFQKTSLTWNNALRHTSGYTVDSILIRCRDALLKVKNGEFPYERDSVLFATKEIFFPLLSALLYVSIQKR
jgi:hypothetical protein